MKTLLALATGAVCLPVFAAGAYARTTPAVYLVTSIRALSQAPDAVRYVVTVRPVGGAARGATLVLGTRQPAVWTDAAPGCLSSGDRTALACDLGDVRESESRTLRLTGRPGASGPASVPVIAQLAAVNAPAVTSSLGGARPAPPAAGPGSAGVVPADDEPASVSGPPSPDPEGSASAESPAAEPPDAESVPDASPLAESAEPSESSAPVSHGDRSMGGPAKAAGHARPAPAPRHTAEVSPAAPSHPAAHALPHAPIIPHMPIIPAVPDVPGAAGAGVAPPPIVPGGPAMPLPAASAPAALPQIATHPSPSEGISELNTLSPAGAMQAGRTSWATLIAVAVVTEAGLLWLVAGFTVWRRKRVRGSRRLARARSPWLLPSRRIP